MGVNIFFFFKMVTKIKNWEIKLSGLKELRSRMDCVGKTKKITDAMKLVSAAKVRKAQQSVMNARPFAENLIRVLYGVNEVIRDEDPKLPLMDLRAVKSLMIVVFTGDRGLCGAFNNTILKKAILRSVEIANYNIQVVNIITVGRKGEVFFKKRIDRFYLVCEFTLGNYASSEDVTDISDFIFTIFVSREVDKVELIYIKFLSLIFTKPLIQNFIPLARYGEMCDEKGICVDYASEEVFRLTTKNGEITMNRETIEIDNSGWQYRLIYEQFPEEVNNSLQPLYLNSTILRALQESIASELAARMNAMTSASDNAAQLGKSLKLVYNRKRQAVITNQLIEIMSGANAV